MLDVYAGYRQLSRGHGTVGGRRTTSKCSVERNRDHTSFGLNTEVASVDPTEARSGILGSVSGFILDRGYGARAFIVGGHD
jgi:hypothetical protein